MGGGAGVSGCGIRHKKPLRERHAAVFFRLFDIILPEQQGDAPQSGDAHQCIDDAAPYCQLSTEYGGHAVKAEQADAAPVQSADNDEDQGDAIYDLHGQTSHL